MKYVPYVVVVGLLLGLLISKGNMHDDSYITIGAVLSLSGSTSSFYGEYNKNALDLKVNEINLGGGINGKKLRMQYEDSEGDKTKGVQAFNKLVHQGISYVISDISPVSVGIGPVAESTKTLLIATSASNPTISDMGEYIFRTKLAAQHEGKIAAEYLSTEIRPRSIAFLYQNTDYGIGVFDSFRKQIDSSIQIVAEQKYGKEDMDMRTQLLHISRYKPDLVLVAGFPKEIGQILKQAAELQTGLTFFAHSGSIGPDIEKVAGVSSVNVMYLTELQKKSKEFEEFSNRYTRTYGVTPELFAANAYDALSLYVAALLECGDVKDCVLRKIKDTKEYNGVAGEITFDENGDLIHRELVCMKLVEVNGKMEHVFCGE